MSDADELNVQGIRHAQAHDYAQAETSFRQAIRLDPGMAAAYSNLGYVLRYQLRLPEALEALHTALSLNQGDAATLENLGLALLDARQYPQAEQVLRHGWAQHPDHPPNGFMLGILLLRLGRYAEGWPYYELRRHLREDLIHSFPFPEWQGEDLKGRSIIICHEQGYGDAVMCARYLPLLKARGAARVSVVCQSALYEFLAEAGVADEIIPLNEGRANVGVHDYWLPAMSLPLRFGTTLDTIPSHLPFLQASAVRAAGWKQRLERAEGLTTSGTTRRLATPLMRVGLVWQGSATHRNDAHRSIQALEQLAPLWSVPGVAFISLQKGRDEAAITRVAATQPMLDAGSQISHFGDTAAIVSQLDLVITVDTAVAHVAGSLGRPCWIMLPYYGSDWRWLDSGETSPWYPGVVRLFRQHAPDTWEPVVQTLAQALAQFVATRESSAGDTRGLPPTAIATVVPMQTRQTHEAPQPSAADCHPPNLPARSPAG